MIATALATDVITGLTKPGQKELPSKYLYDTVGSPESVEVGVRITRSRGRIVQLPARDFRVMLNGFLRHA
jgi:uncharacterized SAM-dependent methyltransferase